MISEILDPVKCIVLRSFEIVYFGQRTREEHSVILNVKRGSSIAFSLSKMLLPVSFCTYI